MIYVIGDIHGNYDKLKSLFYKIGNISSEDTMIFLGDYVDRGDKNMASLKFVYDLSQKYDNIICLKGNHEAMMIDYFQKHSLNDKLNMRNLWLYNGGDKTLTEIQSYAKTNLEEWKKILKWVKKLPYVYQIDEEHMCAHAGYDAQLNKKDEQSCVWSRNEFYGYYEGNQKWLVGHTPVQNFGKDKPMFLDNNIIMLDTGSFIPNGKITCVMIDKQDGKYKYSYLQSDV